MKNHPKIISHLFNLMLQSYQRPFWRVAFILQYAESPLFYKVISEYPKHILEDARVKTGINAITNKNVEKYLKANKKNEVHAEELIEEFSVYKRHFEENRKELSACIAKPLA